MTELKLEVPAGTPPSPGTDPSAATQPPERFVEIVEIAVAPLPGSAPPEPAADPAGAAQADSDGVEADPVAEPDDPYALSPAVRRLVRQYDLDVTGIHGTGPGGRIRVGDVIGLLGGRADTAARPSERRAGAAFADERPERGADAPSRGAERAAAPTPARAAAPSSTVFECDLGRVLARRKRERLVNNAEPLLTSYYVAACREALRTVPEVVAKGGPLPARLGVLLAAVDGEVRTSIVDADDPPLASLDERVRMFDRALRAGGNPVLDTADLLIDNYGASGSLLMTPTPLGPGRAASVGIGRLRRAIVVKNADGEETPRVAAVCYVTLTFLPDQIAPHRANRFVAELVRTLEQWPD